MDYQEALKQVSAKKPASNPYLLIYLDYSTQIILPYKSGIAFLECLQNAEQFNGRHSAYPEIRPLNMDTFEINYLSEVEYQRLKIAQLMQISIRDVESLENNPS